MQTIMMRTKEVTRRMAQNRLLLLGKAELDVAMDRAIGEQRRYIEMRGLFWSGEAEEKSDVYLTLVELLQESGYNVKIRRDYDDTPVTVITW